MTPSNAVAGGGGRIVESVGPGVTTCKVGDHVIPLYQAECFPEDRAKGTCVTCDGYVKVGWSRDAARACMWCGDRDPDGGRALRICAGKCGRPQGRV